MKYLFIVTVLISLSACGVKPSQPKAPDGTQNSFPQVYPEKQSY